MADRDPVAALLRALVGPGVAIATWSLGPDDPPPPALWPAEATTVARAVARRQREVAAGRACARAALAALGRPAVAIPRGPGGAPQWPDGVVGSITHGAGIAAAAVAPRALLAGIGIDLESLAAAGDPALRAQIATPADLCAGWSAVDLGVAFSAKESVFKCVYPDTGEFLAHHDVELALAADADRRGGSFSVRRAGACGADVLAALRGRFAIAGDLVATAVVRPSRG